MLGNQSSLLWVGRLLVCILPERQGGCDVLTCWFEVLISRSVHGTGILRKLSWVVSGLTCVAEVRDLFLGHSYSDQRSFQTDARVLF